MKRRLWTEAEVTEQFPPTAFNLPITPPPPEKPFSTIPAFLPRRVLREWHWLHTHDALWQYHLIQPPSYKCRVRVPLPGNESVPLCMQSSKRKEGQPPENNLESYHLVGTLQPQHEKQTPLTIKLTEMECIVVDRETQFRGLWVVTASALYWLQDPPSTQVLEVPTCRIRLGGEYITLSDLQDDSETSAANEDQATKALTPAVASFQLPSQEILYQRDRAYLELLFYLVDLFILPDGAYNGFLHHQPWETIKGLGASTDDVLLMLLQNVLQKTSPLPSPPTLNDDWQQSDWLRMAIREIHPKVGESHWYKQLYGEDGNVHDQGDDGDDGNFSHEDWEPSSPLPVPTSPEPVAPFLLSPSPPILMDAQHEESPGVKKRAGTKKETRLQELLGGDDNSRDNEELKRGTKTNQETEHNSRSPWRQKMMDKNDHWQDHEQSKRRTKINQETERNNRSPWRQMMDKNDHWLDDEQSKRRTKINQGTEHNNRSPWRQMMDKNDHWLDDEQSKRRTKTNQDTKRNNRSPWRQMTDKNNHWQDGDKMKRRTKTNQETEHNNRSPWQQMMDNNDHWQDDEELLSKARLSSTNSKKQRPGAHFPPISTRIPRKSSGSPAVATITPLSLGTSSGSSTSELRPLQASTYKPPTEKRIPRKQRPQESPASLLSFPGHARKPINLKRLRPWY